MKTEINKVKIIKENIGNLIKISKFNRSTKENTELEFKNSNYTNLNDMINDIKKTTLGNFNESIDVCYTLGINTKKQSVQTNVILPYGIEKKIKICVFAEGEEAIAAKNSGADIVGGEELITKIKETGIVDFNYCLCTHNMYKKVLQIAKLLSLKRVMPSEKNGTVIKTIKELELLIIEFKAGKRLKLKNDSAGYVRSSIGKLNFTNEMLIENIKAVTFGLESVKPAKAKIFIISFSISTTMSRCSFSCSVKTLSQSIRQK